MILLEGIRNLALPCTLALVVPTVVGILVGRLRPLVAVGLVLGAGLAAWAKATGAVVLGRGVIVEVLLAITLAGAYATLYVATSGDGSRNGTAAQRVPARVAQTAGGLVIGGLTSLLWEPCVGALLGQTLSAAPRDPVGTLLPMIMFVTGALLPVGVLVALRAASGSTAMSAAAVRIGSVAAGLLVLVIGAGLWREVVSALVRVTLA